MEKRSLLGVVRSTVLSLSLSSSSSSSAAAAAAAAVSPAVVSTKHGFDSSECEYLNT